MWKKQIGATPDGRLAGRPTANITPVFLCGSQRYYVQSAFEMRTPDKEYQEIRPYTAIEDSFKKIVVTKDHIKLRRDDNGIVTISIYDFLLKENSLDL